MGSHIPVELIIREMITSSWYSERDECKIHLAKYAGFELKEATNTSLHDVIIKIALIYEEKNKDYDKIYNINYLYDKYPYSLEDIMKMAFFIKNN